MSLTTKDSGLLNSSAKLGSPSSRSNPVCLEVGVTIRSLPGDQGAAAQPIREEARTVIVFDNGAVVRCSNNLQTGQRVILTNQKGRDVVCKIADGRGTPAVKGYVELEFLEAVKDFWQIHQSAEPVPAAPPPPPALTLPEPIKEQTSRQPGAPRPPAPFEEPVKPVTQSSGNAPSFEDIAGLVRMSPPATKREPKLASAKLDAPATMKPVQEATERAQSPSLAPIRLSNAEPTAKKAAPVLQEEFPDATPRVRPPAPDFMTVGLLNSAAPGGSAGASGGRTAMIVVGILIVLAGAGGAYYWKSRGSTGLFPASKPTMASEATSSANTPVKTAPVPAQSLPQTELQPAKPARADENQQIQTTGAPVSLPAASASGTDRTSAHGPAKNQVVAQAQASDAASSRRPVIPNLQMKSPTSPRKSATNPGEESVPMTEAVSTGTLNGAPPAALLSASSRASAPPAPPAPAPVPAPPRAKVLTDPKLISSTKPAYPPTARESNIQGSVVVRADVDERGNVVAVTTISGPVFLRQSALESVKQWKYSPATVDGKPVATQVNVTVEFRLK